MSKPMSGALVGGKYQILRAIGEGGMGTVFEAEHKLTHKRAAIKWLHPRTCKSRSAHERLLHEARATARIRHRNVVDVYDVLQDDDAVCLVMQFLVGEPLSERIAQRAMPIWEFIALLLPAMQGVASAHEVGVVHRDIKPDNIFLAHEPGHFEVVPKVIDFGISKIFEPHSSGEYTHSGVTMGTPRYVSYEQLLGARNVDVRTDVYAFGVMLYEAITGQSPYRATTFGEQAVAFATSVPARISALRPETPKALEETVWRAIAKERDARISSMQELISALTPFACEQALPVPFRAFDAPRSRGTTQPLSHGKMGYSVGGARDAVLFARDSERCDSSARARRCPLVARLWSPERYTLQYSRWLGVCSLVGLCVLIALGWSQLKPFHAGALKHGASRDPQRGAAVAQGVGQADEEVAMSEPVATVEAAKLVPARLLPTASSAENAIEPAQAEPLRGHADRAASLRPRRARSGVRRVDAHEPSGVAYATRATAVVRPAAHVAVLGQSARSAEAVEKILYSAGTLARDEF